MSTRSERLTVTQTAARDYLKQNPDTWVSAPDICRALYGNDSDGHEVASMGCTMKYLPTKDSNVHVTVNGKTLLYKWTSNPRADDEQISLPLPRRSLTNTSNTEDVESERCAFASKQMPMIALDDFKLIQKVLDDYASLIIETKPDVALKCAFLSGKLAAAVMDQNRVDGYAYAKVETAKPVKRIPQPPSDEVEEPIKLAEIPEGMTYREMVDAIDKSGVKFGRDWQEFAKYAGMDADYFERVATGQVAQPSRHTMERVYSAIFTVRD